VRVLLISANQERSPDPSRRSALLRGDRDRRRRARRPGPRPLLHHRRLRRRRRRDRRPPSRRHRSRYGTSTTAPTRTRSATSRTTAASSGVPRRERCADRPRRLRVHDHAGALPARARRVVRRRRQARRRSWSCSRLAAGTIRTGSPASPSATATPTPWRSRAGLAPRHRRAARGPALDRHPALLRARRHGQPPDQARLPLQVHLLRLSRDRGARHAARRPAIAAEVGPC
jgi:hypothetical protein